MTFDRFALSVHAVFVISGRVYWLPNGKSGEFYGITALYRKDKQPIIEDLQVLFKLLEEGKLKPIISMKFSILEAAKANELLESGKINGKIVLLAPELL